MWFVGVWDIKRRGDPAPEGIFTVTAPVPALGAAASLLLLAGSVALA